MKKMAMQRNNNEAMRQKIKCQCVSIRLLLADRLQYFFSYFCGVVYISSLFKDVQSNVLAIFFKVT